MTNDAIVAPISSTLAERQIAREADMVDLGRDRAERRDASAARRGDQTRAEKASIAGLIPVAAAFLRAQVEAYSGGRPPSWWSTVRDLDADEVAAAAINTAFRLASSNSRAGKGTDNPHTWALQEFGRALEVVKAHTMLVRAADTGKKRRRVQSLAKRADTARGRRKVILRAAEEQTSFVEAPQAELMHMGQPLANAALATGLFEFVRLNEGTTDETLKFCLSPDGEALVQEVGDLGLGASPMLKPMLVQPRAWDGLHTGAYLTDPLRKQVPLVRTRTPEHAKLLRGGITRGNMKGILRSTTLIQNVPLRINRAVLALRTWAWETGVAFADPAVMPRRDTLEVPDVPEGMDEWTRQDRRAFWESRKLRQRENGGIAPNLISWGYITDEAVALAEEDRFFLPHNLDFRGRCYPVPAFSHHHSDATRALVEFAEGQPLGDWGLHWLAVHLANTGDFDKISKRPYAERVDWVTDNLDMIVRVARDPHVNLEWTEADAPFSFYAAAVDYVAALESEDPAAYVSHLPVALDGSNSGVQHYSAALRAEEGRYVNLTPEAVPQDLYGAVAEVVTARCAHVAALARAMCRPGVDWIGVMDATNKALDGLAEAAGDNPLSKTQKALERRLKARRDVVSALLWHLEGVGRSTVKRNVMTFGYSSEAYGMGQQLRTDYMGPLTRKVLEGKLERHPFGADNGRAAAFWLGRQVYRACLIRLPKVAEGMHWLQRAAEVLAHEQRGVLMITPLGFPMLMKTCEWEQKEVKLHLLDRKVSICGEVNEWDKTIGGSVLRRVKALINTRPGKHVLKHKQASGVAPNVIHACDSTHLHMVVLGLADAGVRDMLLIHDSFAVHAGAVQVLNGVLRSTFVSLYEGWNPLADVKARAEEVLSDAGREALPPLPAPGSLDLSGVMASEFCFS